MPVYSSHLVDYAGLGIGRRIREERQKRGLTLRQLAAKIYVSEAKLSNVETGKVSLDLAELAQIAAALEVTLGAFFPRTTVQHHLVKRAHELSSEPPVHRILIGPEPGPSRHHNAVWSLAELFVGKHMEPLLAHIQPLPDRDLHFIAHDHEEFMFVVKGEVETLLKTNEGVASERLRAGDALYFRSNLPHCHRSATSQPAETVNVIYSMRGVIDPFDGELGPPGRRYYRRGVYADAAREASDKVGLLRRLHGLTLSDLAAEIEIGSRQLAQIEAGEKAPDLHVLLRLARRFRQPIEYFFSTTLESQPYYFIQRREQIEELPVRQRRVTGDQNGGNGVYRPLARGFPDRGMHPYYVQVVPDRVESLQTHEHAGEEFIFVLAGELELITYETEERIELLSPGDSVFLDSSVPHMLRGRSRNPYATTHAELLDVFWSPLGQEYLFNST